MADEIKNRLSKGFIHIDVLSILLKQKDQKVKEDIDNLHIGQGEPERKCIKRIIDKRAGKL